MKVTVSAAMRARDVSRPHAGHLAYAEAAEASTPGSRLAGAGLASADERLTADAGPATDALPADTALAADVAALMDAAPGDETLGEARAENRPGRPGGGRRRFRPRGSGRGRTSR
jgi:hypothetical protein